MIHTPQAKVSTGNRPERASFLLFAALIIFVLNPLPARADDRTVVRRVPPVYPEMAKRLHISGTVKVVTIIDAAGTVSKAEGQGGNKILSSAAEDAVKQWKFAPGSGVDTMVIQINFAE